MPRRLPYYQRLYRRLLRSPRRQRRLAVASCLLLVAAVILVPMLPPYKEPDHGLHYRGAVDIAWLSPAVRRWQAQIDHYAQAYDIDADLVGIIVTLESNGDPHATSLVGAQGLMQVMPATGEDIALRRLHTPRAVASYDLYDPATNLEFGTAYLAFLRKTFNPPTDDTADYVRVIAAGYNGGPGAAKMLLHDQPGRGKENIDYAEGAALLWRNRLAATMPTVHR